jgi:mono/diheme cytochrome c family protein
MISSNRILRVPRSNATSVSVLATLAMVAGILWSSATVQSTTAAAAPDSSEIYQSVYSGWKWWHVYCYRCHGQNAVGSTLGPSLIDPNAKMTLPEFLKKVKNGNPDKGMQAWNKLLDDAQITQLYNYVRARADGVLPPGRPDEVGPNGSPWVPPEGWPKTK